MCWVFRQFSLRGTQAAAGEWGLVCLLSIQALHTLSSPNAGRFGLLPVLSAIISALAPL